ncbi:hypothetical protein F22031_00010 [Pseudomonas aeruginosa]|nr:hypothetical protein F22031_00010 [Pseudomonas aeruginosa]
MPVSLPFEQVDVFSEQPFKGNAVAVVIGADRLSSRQMLEFAAWTQLRRDDLPVAAGPLPKQTTA